MPAPSIPANRSPSASAGPDRRAILRELDKPERRDAPGAFVHFEPRRGRAHIVIHQGRGSARDWMSISIDAASFNAFRADIIDYGSMKEPRAKRRTKGEA